MEREDEIAHRLADIRLEVAASDHALFRMEIDIEAVREAVGSEMSLMVDFNQGLQFGEALERCHAIDDPGLAWIEEPIVYDNLEATHD